MNASEVAHAQGYKNAMEMLVAAEVRRQFPKLHPSVARHISPVEIETYALNRLPALYATSQRGWKFQQKRAQDEFHSAIAVAVQQAMAAVQMDPLRLSKPISVLDSEEQRELEAAQAALKELKHLLKRPDLTWQTLVPSLKRKFKATPPEATVSEPTSVGSSAWRPGTYGGSVSWHRKMQPSHESDIWSNDWYSR